MTADRQQKITLTLKKALDIHTLSVVNESGNHHVPKNAETHFKVTVVSSSFQTSSLLQRHKQINQLLKEEFKEGLHALSIHAYTPTEWEKRQAKTRPSPNCKDGFDK